MSIGEKLNHKASSAPVGFLELFYDLVFVASIMVLSNEFSNTPTWRSAGQCSLMFVLIWLLWFHTTVLMNVDRRDDLVHRSLTFLQMFLIFVFTLEFVDRSVTDPDLVGIIYTAAVLVLAISYNRLRNADGGTGAWARGRRNRLLIAGLAMIVAFVMPTGLEFIVWAGAIMLLVVPTRASHSRGLPPDAIDQHHLVERAALLSLIVIGEAFVKVALVVSSGSLRWNDIYTIIVLFIVLFALFSIYFDDVPKAGIRPGIIAGELWLLAHLVLQLGVVSFAIGMSKFLQIAEGGHVHDYAIVILCAAFVGIFGGLAAIGMLGERTPRRPLLVLRLVSIALVLVAGLVAWNYTSVTPSGFVAMLLVLVIAHAVIDEFLQRSTVVPSHAESSHGAKVAELEYSEEES